MNASPKINMMTALRLTREGRLKEAMAELRGSGAALPVAAPALPKLPALPAVVKGVVGRLATLGAAAADLPAQTAPAAAKVGARFESRTYADATGKHTYKLFVPSTYHGQPAPLVVMLHGCTQSPDDFAAGTRMNALAEAQTFLVAYPAQARTANISKCWNWFNTENQHRDQGEAALIAGITRQIMAEFAVQPKRVFVAGLSAGGALAAIMGATYPELYAAVGVHSGLACGAAHDMPSAFMAMKQGAPASPKPPGERPVPTIVFHGDNDHTVNFGNAAQVLDQARAGAPLSSKTSAGETDGVPYTRTVERGPDGRAVLEQWALHGTGHAWSGGDPAGSFTDPHGPDASREMLRFFLEQ